MASIVGGKFNLFTGQWIPNLQCGWGVQIVDAVRTCIVSWSDQTASCSLQYTTALGANMDAVGGSVAS